MAFTVVIVRNCDGQRATHIEHGIWDEGAAYRWTEGNDGCDCSRAVLFADARDEPDPWPPCSCGQVPFKCTCPRPPCGDSLFSVELPAPTWPDHGYSDIPGRVVFRSEGR